MAEDKRHILHGGRQDSESQEKGETLIKSSDPVRLIHYQENSMGKTTPMIQLPPTESFP